MIVAVTIRADRYEPLQIAPQLAELKTALFDDLKPMPPAGYKEVITGPARRATAAGQRLLVEPALVERLLGETAEGADALPLLALSLERLYRDFGDDGDLTVAEYESMGGMAQVVQLEVDSLLAADPQQRQADHGTLHDAFIPWLTTINPNSDQPMRRLARWDDLPAASHPLIQAMVEKRLPVKDTRDGQVVVEVALESAAAPMARDLAAWLREEASISEKTPQPGAPAAAGKQAAITKPGCWKAPASPRPKPWPPNPASATASIPPATTCTLPGGAKTTASRPRSSARKPNCKPPNSTRLRCGNARGYSLRCWRSPSCSPCSPCSFTCGPTTPHIRPMRVPVKPLLRS